LSALAQRPSNQPRNGFGLSRRKGGPGLYGGYRAPRHHLRRVNTPKLIQGVEEELSRLPRVERAWHKRYRPSLKPHSKSPGNSWARRAKYPTNSTQPNFCSGTFSRKSSAVNGVHSCFQTARSQPTNDFIIRERHRRPILQGGRHGRAVCWRSLEPGPRAST
jgi:hypothetical protein